MKTKQFNLAEAKAKLSRLVDQAARGESVVIAKAGSAYCQTRTARGGDEEDQVRRTDRHIEQADPRKA